MYHQNTKYKDEKEKKRRLLFFFWILIAASIITAIILLISFNCTGNKKSSNKQFSPTWTQDTFTYDGNLHYLEITNLPKEAEITYLNDTNSATAVGVYPITATITAPNYDEWTGSHNLTIKGMNMPTINWSQDTFTYNASLHSLEVIGAPIGATVTYSGGEDDSNGATAVGVYPITATITAPNYDEWTGSHDLTINRSSYIVLQNGIEYNIDTSNNFPTNRGSVSSDTGYWNFSEPGGIVHNNEIQRNQITEIHITDLPLITNAPDNYLAYMCQYMTNLTTAEIIIPDTITSVGDFFCSSVFYNCTNLVTLPSSFNLPQGINTIGQGFCVAMFRYCSNLTALPSSFNLPQQITNGSWYFCQHMFSNCPNLVTLPINFNIPKNIITADNAFCQNMFSYSGIQSLPIGFTLPQFMTSSGTQFCILMFSYCNSLTSLPTSFNLPQAITSVGESFCEGMFQYCSRLVQLPANFNLPQGIIGNVHNQFCMNMFSRCGQLISLPANFNIPQGITSAGDSFCAEMFYRCTNLKNDSPSLVTIHIPNIATIGSDPCWGMFTYTGTTNDESPVVDSYVTVNQN